MSPFCGRQENIPTLASKPELQRRPAGALWNAAMDVSRSSAYVLLPSSKRDPPEPSVKSGWRDNSFIKALRRSGSDDSDRKSFDEKLTDADGFVVCCLKVEFVLLLFNAAFIAASSRG